MAKIILLLQLLWSPVCWPYGRMYNLYVDTVVVLARYVVSTYRADMLARYVLSTYRADITFF